MVKTVAELPKRINEAFEIATSGRPGPVLVDLPNDVSAAIFCESPFLWPAHFHRILVTSSIHSALSTSRTEIQKPSAGATRMYSIFHVTIVRDVGMEAPQI